MIPRPTAAILTGLLIAVAGSARAVTPVTPVGVDTCDAFLAAYAQCAASPGVPEVARPGLRQGITTMRDSFREAVARDERARKTVGYQCAQAHETVRKRLIEAFKCDFPAAQPATAELVPPPTPRTVSPVRPTGATEADPQTIAKADAYTAVQNSIVTFHPIAKDLAEYQRNNERVLRLGTKLGANAFYLFGISDFDSTIERLKSAMELPGSVPEVDTAAARLLTTLETLNPVLKGLARYQTTREFKEDDYKFARAQHPIFVAGMERAAQAADAFGDALFDREVARDERRLTSMPEDALSRRLLGTSLAARRAVRRFEALQPKGDVAPFLATIAEVSETNKVLTTTLGGLSPKASSSCTRYTDDIASMIGHGRDVARDIRAGSNPSNPAERFGSYYNNSVRGLGSCQRDEARAR